MKHNIYRFLPAMLSLLILFSCETRQEVKQEVTRYYNIDSLLNSLSVTMPQKQRQAGVVKTAVIDGEEEVIKFRLDSAALAREISMFRLLDINQPSLARSYDIAKENRETVYNLKDNEQNSGVIELRVLESGTETRIRGLFKEKNNLYYTRREMEFTVQDGFLISYQLDGLQKMLFKDTVRFSVKGNIIGEFIK